MLIFFLKKNSFVLIIYLPIANVLLIIMFTQLRTHEPRQIILDLYEMAHIVVSRILQIDMFLLSVVSKSYRENVQRFLSFDIVYINGQSLRLSNFITSFIGNSIFWKFSTIVQCRQKDSRSAFLSGWVQSGDHRPRGTCIAH